MESLFVQLSVYSFPISKNWHLTTFLTTKKIGFVVQGNILGTETAFKSLKTLHNFFFINKIYIIKSY